MSNAGRACRKHHLAMQMTKECWSDGMAAAMLPLLLLWGCAEAANEQETNIGDFLFDDQKVHLYFVRGDLAPSNWSFFELKWEGRLRIILDSLNGDADLYLSYTKASGKRPGVGVHDHDMLSATCGLDVLDVPQSAKRPVHLGVYGHPSKSETSYKMLFFMMEKQESEFEEDVNIPAELIHSFETEEEHSSYSHSFRETLFTISRFMFEVLIEILL
uniref:DOMON domain-containing protein n=1 Tax=Ascaris lumbricoides TaxID=6252 RepID=A0A9J2P886_ASCLU